jgi:RNA polymerase sigma-70 factor, ECF subfamily
MRSETGQPSDRVTNPPIPDFRSVYDEGVQFVWRALRRFGIPERALPDAAQDVFVVVHRRLADYDRTRPLKPWLAGIAVRVASDYRRRASSVADAVSEVVSPDLLDPRSPADGDSRAREARELVARGLAALDDDKRTVFVLHELEGFSMPEIAESIDAPLNTLYSRLRAARLEFTATVRQLGGGTP